MTSTQLKERIEKAEKRAEAKRNTIIKKNNLIDKKSAQVIKAGYTVDESGKRRAYDDSNTEIGWTIFDIETYKDDIKRLNSEIIEIEAMIQKYKMQLVGELKKENILDNLPPIMKTMEEELYERWLAWDLQRKSDLKKSYEKVDSGEITHRQWMLDHKHAGWIFMHKTDAELEKENRDAAKHWVIDLYNRVYEITGEITDYSNVHFSGNALNGYFIGKMGRAKVETIIASGPVQCTHYRCLVHSF